MTIWQNANWPNWRYDLTQLAGQLAAVRHDQGRLLGRMASLGFKRCNEAWLQTLTQDVIKTSEIEGEHLAIAPVRSSIARRLGIDIGALAPVDRHIEGIVEITLDATRHYAAPLSAEHLLAWHGALFPTGRSGLSPIRVAAWRDDASGPMQVISGPIGREIVHFEAPPAERLDAEISRFLNWFNQPKMAQGHEDPVIKAGLAHLWFVTLHPFDDGNGRIARAIGDRALAQAEQSPQRFYSLSAQIQKERADYYAILETTQHNSMDVTAWLQWFLSALQRAIVGAEESLAAILDKARFWERFSDSPMNERQIKILNRLLDGFDGKLTTSKWAKLAKCSQDTAYRDILALTEIGALVKTQAGGRSTSYELCVN